MAIRFNLLFISFIFISSCSTWIPVPDTSHEGADRINSADGIVIRDFCQDGKNLMWMNISQHGLLRFDGQDFIRYTHSDYDEGSISSNLINDMITDSKGNLWIATQKGVDRFNDGMDCFDHINIDDFNSYVISLYENHEGNIYALTPRATLEFDPSLNVFRKIAEFNEIISTEPCPVFDGDGRLWIRTYSGIAGFNKNFTDFRKIDFTHESGGDMALLDNKLIYLDGHELMAIDVSSMRKSDLPGSLGALQGRNIFKMINIGDNYLLFDTDNGCLCFNIPYRIILDREQHDAYRILSAYKEGNTMAFDQNHNLWCAKNNGGYKVFYNNDTTEPHLNMLYSRFANGAWASSVHNERFLWLLFNYNSILTFDLLEKRIAGISNLSELTNGTMYNISSIHLSSDGRLLLNGSLHQGTTMCTLSIDDSGLPHHECTYMSPVGMVASFDKKGNLWGAASNSLIYYAPKPSKGQKLLDFEVATSPDSINDIAYASSTLLLRDGRILIGYTDNHPLLFDPDENSFKYLNISDNDVQVYYQKMFEDSRGDIWISTTDNGLFHYVRSEGVMRQETETGDLTVSDFVEDSSGNIFLLSSSRKLFLYSRDSGTMHLLWQDTSIMPTTKRILKVSENKVALFSPDWVKYFNSKDIGTRSIPSPVSVTLFSGNKELLTVSSGKYDKKIKLALDAIPENLNLFFSVPSDLAGRNYNCIFRVNSNKKDYSMAPCTSGLNVYKLRYGINVVNFRMQDSDNLTETPEYTLLLKVRIPWHMHVFFIFLTLLPILLIVMAYQFKKKKVETEHERREKEIQEQTNINIIDFFSNISHEFRAPLTLINAAVTSLYDNEGHEKEKEHTVNVIKRNVDRLLKLVAQLLDFNKLEHDMLKLEVRLDNISSIIRRSCDFFEIGARTKSIDFSVRGCDQDILGYIDSDKLEKIIYNLCSNALKFTPPGGSVCVNCFVGSDNILSVSVEDTGIGIQEDKISHLFDRFSQLAINKSGGTGIGLYYTKSLVNLHHGSITASNRYDEKDSEHVVKIGSVFRFNIPLDRSEYTDDEINTSDTARIAPAESISNQSEYMTKAEEQKRIRSKQTILLIDDDYEIVHYLRSLLSSEYNVCFRFDAMSGYHQIEERLPDLIICDMMMMDVDGLELCRMVKDNISMCHIPFIMLTGRSSVEDQIKSLNIGADAYVIKPFDPSYLTALVHSMIKNRVKMKNILQYSLSAPAGSENTLGTKDKEFLDLLYQTMEENVSKNEFDSNSFAEKIGVSRSKLFYKVKSLTDQTPNEFFNTYKLNRAAQLIEEDKYKISTIAGMVGFNSPSHFSIVFKKQFGVLPSEFLSTKKQLWSNPGQAG